MMQISPLIIWAAELNIDDFQKATEAVVELIHPDQLVKQAIVVYGLAI